MSSDSATTVPFQVAVVMSRYSPRLSTGRGRSPAEGVHLAGLRRPAGTAVAPGDDAQRCRRRAALGTVDGLLRVCPRLADLLGAFLVDGLVTPAGAPQMSFGAASGPGSDGVPPRQQRWCDLTILRCTGLPRPPYASASTCRRRRVPTSRRLLSRAGASAVQERQACRSANVATAWTTPRPSCSTSASQTVRCSPRVRTRAVTVSSPGFPGRR